MILYLETQLDKAYDTYRRHQIKNDVSLVSKENFRTMIEEIMKVVEQVEPESYDSLQLL